MNLKSMLVENFLGIGHAHISFDKPGITLIEGKNHDSPSSTSNGAGKSSLFEALFWVLFGITKRGLKADDIINTYADKAVGTMVNLEFDDYRLIRARKHTAYGTGLYLKQITDEGEVELTKGTVKDTQDLLESIIKISPLTFSKIAYFGQEDVKPFASLTDAELKQVFEQSLGLTFFSEDMAKLKARKAEVDRQINVQKAALDRLDGDIESYKEKIDYLSRARDELREKVEGERERLRKEIGSLLNQIGATTIKRHKTRKAMAKCQEQLETLNAKIKELTELDRTLVEKWKSKTYKVSEHRSQAKHLEKLIEEKLAELRSASDKVGAPCETCGRPFSKDDIEQVVERLKNKIRKVHEKYNTHSDALEDMEPEIEKLEGYKNDLMAKITEVNEQATNLKSEISAHKSKISEWSILLTNNVTTLKEKRATLGGLSADDSKYTAEIDEANRDLDFAKTSRAQIQEQIDHLEKDLGLTDKLAQIMGNGGLKSYIFDSVTPQLNEFIHGFITLLDDIDVEIATVTKLKSGDYREKFSVTINNHHGASTYAGNSGGEKSKINLAIALAFNKLIRSMAEASVNVTFLDEPFENLDEGSSEKVIELIEGFESSNVFLITHNPAIRDLVSQTVTIEKRGGRSMLEAA